LAGNPITIPSQTENIAGIHKVKHGASLIIATFTQGIHANISRSWLEYLYISGEKKI
jgi:hypothetical protein